MRRKKVKNKLNILTIIGSGGSRSQLINEYMHEWRFVSEFLGFFDETVAATSIGFHLRTEQLRTGEVA